MIMDHCWFYRKFAIYKNEGEASEWGFDWWPVGFLVLCVLEIGYCKLENVYLWVDILGHSFQDQHVGEKGCEFSFKFHIMISDNIEHSSQQLDSLEIIDALVIKNLKQIHEIIHILLKFPNNNFFAIEAGQAVDHFRAHSSVAV